MGNSIALFKEYTTLLDEVYKNSSLTSVLDGDTELVRQGANANELIIPKMTMDGLADYSRNGGYTSGDVTMTNETVACNYDRGRMFTVDAMDDIETAGLAFGKLSSEFIRTKVVPELDAFRLASYAGATYTEGSQTYTADVTQEASAYADGEAVRKAIASKYDAMTDAEVPQENRYLFITTTYAGMLRDMDTTKSKELINKFAGVIEVPTSRFVSAIALNDGKTSGQTAGGYAPASGSHNMNFLIIHKDAVIQFEKHLATKVITPEMNQDSDGWKFGYRNVGIAKFYENKIAGIAGEYATATN